MNSEERVTVMCLQSRIFPADLLPEGWIKQDIEKENRAMLLSIAMFKAVDRLRNHVDAEMDTLKEEVRRLKSFDLDSKLEEECCARYEHVLRFLDIANDDPESQH